MTETDKEILIKITRDKTNAEIARELHISIRYAEKRIKKLKADYGVKTRAGLAVEFLKENFANL